MILQLKNNSITIKKPYTPENIHNTKVSYVFELNTNQYTPVLYIDGDSYVGNNILLDLSKYVSNSITLKVCLIDGVGRIMRTYENTFIMYNTFSLGTKEQIDVYEELIKAQEKIKKLEEQGEVI